MTKNIYFDNAATTWPKPPGVLAAIQNFMSGIGANPGRSGHSKSVDAGRILFETRELISEFFNAGDSDRVVFTLNATQAINIALKGIIKKEDHVLTSSFEHNSVMRPLNWLRKKINIEFTKIKNNTDNSFDLKAFENSIRPNTKLVVTTHASNVTGQILPIREIGKICKRYNLLFLVDSAQTAGIMPIDMHADNIDFLAFTGHKSLYGPQGVGGLCLKKSFDVQSLFQGGSGSKSEQETEPDFLPDKLEAGTPNTPGIAGLKAGLEFIIKIGINKIMDHKTELTKELISGLQKLNKVKVYSPINAAGIVSFNVDGVLPSELGNVLDKKYGIMVRPGLHCAPAAHKTNNTFPFGTVRISLGFFNTPEQISCFLNVLDCIGL